MTKSDKQQLPYTPSHVANFFLDCAEEEGNNLTMLKLQKIVYFAYGWTLAVLGEELFDTAEHPIRRYRYGPVLESLYWEYKFLKNRPIDRYSRSLNNDGEFEVKRIRAGNKVYEVLQQVWKGYGALKNRDLIAMTHEDDSPWDKADKRGDARLDKKEIAQYFKAKI